MAAMLSAAAPMCAAQEDVSSTTYINLSGDDTDGYQILPQAVPNSDDCTPDTYEFYDVQFGPYSISDTYQPGIITPAYPFGPGSYPINVTFYGVYGLDNGGNNCYIEGSSASSSVVIPMVTPVLVVTPPIQEVPEDSTLTIPVNVNVLQTTANPDPPTGTVSLYDGATKLATATLGIDSTGQNGAAKISASTKGVPQGKYSVEVVYSGDANYYPVTGSPFTVNISSSLTATTTTLTAAPSTVILGNTLTLTAHVGPEANNTEPTGTVTFSSGSTTLGSAKLNSGGSASISLTASGVPVGTYNVIASYGGDTNYQSSTSAAVPVNVISQGTTTTTITATPASQSQGGAVSLVVTVTPQQPDGSPPPSGAVSLALNGSNLTTLTLAGGSATLSASTTGLATGSYPLTAKYSGSATYVGSTSPVTTVTVTPGATLSVSANPNPVSQGTVTVLTATATQEKPGSLVPTGTVTFSYNEATLGTATLSNGTATLPIGTGGLATGTDVITVAYSGDSNFPAASTTLNLVVQ